MNKKVMTLTLATALAIGSSALVAHAADEKVDNQNSVADPAKPNSGPGVQGAPDTRTGPSTRAPGDAESGASTGAGDGSAGASDGATTQPSQDSSGVEGLPGNKSGPAEKPAK